MSEICSSVYIGLHVKYPLFLSDLTKLEYSRQIFDKYSNIKCHDHSVGAELFHIDGRTDKHDEPNSCFSQFCESAKKKKNYNMLTQYDTVKVIINNDYFPKQP